LIISKIVGYQQNFRLSAKLSIISKIVDYQQNFRLSAKFSIISKIVDYQQNCWSSAYSPAEAEKTVTAKIKYPIIFFDSIQFNSIR
jgi:hypothetical protein